MTQRSLTPSLALDQLQEAREALHAALVALAGAVDHLDEPERGAVVGLRAEVGASVRRADSLTKFVRTAHRVDR